ALLLEDPADEALLVLAVVAGEPDVAVEEYRDEVAGPWDVVEEADRRLLGQLQLLQHALARVEQQPQVHRETLLLIGRVLVLLHGLAEDLDLLGPAVLVDREVLGAQVRYELSVLVADRDRDVDDVEIDAEHGLARGRARRRGGSAGHCRQEEDEGDRD